MGAYRWLAENYQDGDKIYLFGMRKTNAYLLHLLCISYLSMIGFSRGAYQVRVLAGMIDKVSDCVGFTVRIPTASD